MEITKNVKIKGLEKSSIVILLTYMQSKLTDKFYINSIECGGNKCNMDWMKDGMDISGEDMVHELFDMYAFDDYNKESNSSIYELILPEGTFTTTQTGENWSDHYTFQSKLLT